MNLRMKQAITTAVLVGGACLVPSPARAEHISFNLPIRAHWGPAILQPGEHTFDIPSSASSWPQEIVLTQNGGDVRIFPITEAGGAESNHTYLRLVDVGGSYFVREFISGATGKRFTFGIPKELWPALSAKAPDKSLPADSPGR